MQRVVGRTHKLAVAKSVPVLECDFEHGAAGKVLDRLPVSGLRQHDRSHQRKCRQEPYDCRAFHESDRSASQ